MIPPTPTSLTTMPASKAKIGFSIDSIVGDKTTKDNRNDFKFNDYQTEIARALRLSSDSLNPDLNSKFRNGNDKETRHNLFDFSTKRESSLSPSAPYAAQTGLPTEENTTRKSRSPSPHRTTTNNNNNNNNNTNINNNSMTPGNGGPNNNNLHSSGSNPNSNESSPIVPLPFSTFRENHPSGPIRPMPIVPPANLVEQKTLPSFLGLGGGAHANPHLLQIQMATVMAQRQAAEQGFVPGAPFRHAPQSHLMNPAMAREGYPLYPWLLSRHGRMFPHFPGNFLLHPFRKPKRVRTAFSPGQLLKLEHAFESNQYVVGAERKALAQALNLSETQVKVWFQNRRTKHKRMQQEDDTKGEGGHHSNNNDGSYDDEEEMIDMEMDDCSSDDEHGGPH